MVGYPIYFTIWDVGLGNTSSPRLAMLSLLRAKLKDFVAHFGLKCSSLCQMNCGTNMRAPCCSLGFDKYPSVFLSNVLSDRTRARNMSDNSLHLGCYRFGFCSPVKLFGFKGHQSFGFYFSKSSKQHSLSGNVLVNGRMCALLLLTTCLGGAWTVEQPLGSVLEFYTTFRRVVKSIYDAAGPFAVSAFPIQWYVCSLVP